MSSDKSILELIKGEKPYSEPFDYKSQKLRFRLLNSTEIEWCRLAAQRRSLKDLEQVFGDREVALDIMKGHAPNIDAHVNWQDLYILASTLCAENKGPVTKSSDPYDQAQEIADTFTPIERAHLIQLYLDFADEHDPQTNLTPEIEEQIIEDAKKNNGSSLKDYGSDLLRNCVLTLVTRLEAAHQEINALHEIVDVMETDPIITRLDKLEQEISQITQSGDGT